MVSKLIHRPASCDVHRWHFCLVTETRSNIISVYWGVSYYSGWNHPVQPSVIKVRLLFNFSTMSEIQSSFPRNLLCLLSFSCVRSFSHVSVLELFWLVGRCTGVARAFSASEWSNNDECNSCFVHRGQTKYSNQQNNNLVTTFIN